MDNWERDLDETIDKHDAAIAGQERTKKESWDKAILFFQNKIVPALEQLQPAFERHGRHLLIKPDIVADAPSSAEITIGRGNQTEFRYRFESRADSQGLHIWAGEEDAQLRDVSNEVIKAADHTAAIIHVVITAWKRAADERQRANV